MTEQHLKALLKIGEKLREHYLGKEKGELAVKTAQELFELVVELADKEGNIVLKLSALGHIAIIHKNNYRVGHDKQGLERAAELLQQCADEAPNVQERAIYQIELGSMFLEMGKLDRAAENFQQAYENAAERDKCHVTTKLAQLEIARGDLEKAERYLEEAFEEIARSRHWHPAHKLGAWLVRAELENKKGNAGEARVWAQKALAEAEKGQLEVRAGQARLLLELLS